MIANVGRAGLLYRFGPFEADARSGELRKGLIRVRLREQPFQILLMLLERPGEVVLREEIRLRLWPDNSSVDFDHGINTAVKRLRDALSETAAQPGHLETVGRRGYRFLGDVEVVRKPPSAMAKARRPFWLWVAIALGLFSAAIGWQLWRLPAGRNEIVIPITTFPGVARDPSLSPDGSKVAFTWGGDRQDNVDIYVREIGTSGLVRLTTDPGADEYPAWSPDDRSIAFLRSEENGTASVMVIPPLGGLERKISELGPRLGPDEIGTPVPLSWTPDGKWLAIALRDSTGEPRAIWLISVDTGERRRLTSPEGLAVADTNPSVSPDGAFLAFSRGRVSQYAQRPFVVPLARDWRPAGEPRPLPASSNLISGIAWAGPREIVYSGGGGATGHLWRVEVSGRRAAARLSFSEDALCPSISTRSHRLAYASRTFDSDIWRLNVRTGERKPWIVARGAQAFPQYSPDGRRIAFASTRSGDQEIWTCDAEGANCSQLTSIGGPQTGAPHWSPDGRWLAFDARPEGVAQIYKIPADGGTPRRLSSGITDDFTPSWSHDGNWIYFASSRTGRWEIWKMSAQGGPAVQLTKDGGYWPEETLDGRAIYYAKPEKPGLFRVPAEGGNEVQVLPRLPNPQAWALSARGLYFFEPRDHNALSNTLAAFRQPLSPAVLRFEEFGKPPSQPILELERERFPRLGMCVSPDGTYVLGSWFQIRGDVMLVEHFR
jgi:Tol biopolymer transport system component/DNA-binding winged helix-turn-helix (wHTH) protein